MIQLLTKLKCLLQVVEVNDMDVVCEAQSSAVLQGLLTIYHLERNQYGTINNSQNTLPILSDYDKESIATICKEFEVDFLCLSHTRCKEDVVDTKDYLDSKGFSTVKIVSKVGLTCLSRICYSTYDIGKTQRI